MSKHCFNLTLEKRLWAHLVRCRDLDLGAPARPIPLPVIPLLGLSLLEVYPVLPANAVLFSYLLVDIIVLRVNFLIYFIDI
jgi:hypothetical protein